MKPKSRRRNGRRPSRRLCLDDLKLMVVERVVCTVCGESFWHVEVSEDGTRDGWLPPCASCGGPVLAVLPGLER